LLNDVFVTLVALSRTLGFAAAFFGVVLSDDKLRKVAAATTAAVPAKATFFLVDKLLVPGLFDIFGGT